VVRVHPALYVAMQALVGPGDEVLVIEPFYDSYPAAITLAGATPVYVPLRRPTPYARPTVTDSAGESMTVYDIVCVCCVCLSVSVCVCERERESGRTGKRHRCMRARERMRTASEHWSTLRWKGELEGGCRAAGMPLSSADWYLDVDELARAVTPRTRALIINSPLNPLGPRTDACTCAHRDKRERRKAGA
jgi:hypothetical protein